MSRGQATDNEPKKLCAESSCARGEMENGLKIGVHLHSTADNWKGKLDAALDAGCLRVDGALKGIGGCPMAGNDLVGNMNTELMLPYLKNIGLLSEINQEALSQSISLASEIFV